MLWKETDRTKWAEENLVKVMVKTEASSAQAMFYEHEMLQITQAKARKI